MTTFDAGHYIDEMLDLRCNIFVIGLGGGIYPGVYEEVPEPPNTKDELERLYAAKRLYADDPRANRKVFDELIRRGRIVSPDLEPAGNTDPT
jgi:hypothetical protein